MKTCPEGDVVYGLQTSVEPEQGSGDDSALNRVKFLCRKRGKGHGLSLVKKTFSFSVPKPKEDKLSIQRLKKSMNWFVHFGCLLRFYQMQVEDIQ